MAVGVLVWVLFLSPAATREENSDRNWQPQKSQDLYVQVIDVGQGESILIISPTGSVSLIDAGSYKGGRVVLQALLERNISKIDYLVATHAQAEHVGGMDSILEKFKIGAFLESGVPTKSATYERLSNAINQHHNIRRVVAVAGQTYEMGEGVKLEVLNPPGKGRWIKGHLATRDSPDPNANSVVLRLSYKDFVMLLMGDALEETERDLLSRRVRLRAQVVKIGEHGGRSATSKAFLSASEPRTAVISCGSDNRYGFPRQETLDRLRERNIDLFRTDLQGNITITTNGINYNVKADRDVSKTALFSGNKGPVSGNKGPGQP